MDNNTRFHISSHADLSALTSSSPATHLQELKAAFTQERIADIKKLVRLPDVDISQLDWRFVSTISNEMREVMKFYRRQQMLYPRHENRQGNRQETPLHRQMRECHCDFDVAFRNQHLTNEQRSAVMAEVKSGQALSAETLDLLRVALLLTPISQSEATWLRAAVKAEPPRIVDPGMTKLIGASVHNRKPGSSTGENWNGELEMLGEMLAVCVHMSLDFADQSTKPDGPHGRTKPNWALYQSKENLRTHMAGKSGLEEKAMRVVVQSTETHLVRNRDLGIFAIKQFEQMQLEILAAGRNSAGRQFLLGPFAHGMNLDLIIKKDQDGTIHYLSRLYDPNISDDHARLDSIGWTGLALEDLGSWVEDDQKWNLYFDNNKLGFSMLFRRRDEDLGDEIPPIKNRTLTSCAPLQSADDFKAAMQYFVHRRFPGNIYEMEGALRQNLTPEEIVEVLKCEAHPDGYDKMTPGITMPCSVGANDVIHAYLYVAKKLVPSRVGYLLQLRDAKGDTALHNALLSKNFAGILATLAGELPPSCAADRMLDQNSHGNTLLHLAIEMGHDKIAALAPVLARLPTGDRLRVLQAKNPDGLPPLGMLLNNYFASESRFSAFASLLLKEEIQTLLDEMPEFLPARPDVRAISSCEHLLEKVPEQEEEKLPTKLRRLLTDVNAQNSKGMTRLHYACNRPTPDHDAYSSTSSAPDILEELLAIPGIDLNKRTNEGFTPLHLAVIQGNFPAVMALLNKKANVHVKDNNGNTPLDLACDIDRASYVTAMLWEADGLPATARNMEHFKELLEMRLDELDEPEFIEKAGQLLHIAAMSGNALAAEILLEIGGADVANARDAAGRSAFVVACGSSASIAKMLLEWTDADGKSIDVSAPDVAEALYAIVTRPAGNLPDSMQDDVFALLALLHKHIAQNLPNYDINAKAQNSLSAFSVAVTRNNVAVVRAMLNLPYSVDEEGRLTSISINPNDLRVRLQSGGVLDSELAFALTFAQQGDPKTKNDLSTIAQALVNDPRVDPMRAIRWLSPTNPGILNPTIRATLAALGHTTDRESWIAVLKAWADKRPIGVTQDPSAVSYANFQLGYALIANPQSESAKEVRINALKEAYDRFSVALMQLLRNGESTRVPVFVRGYWNAVQTGSRDDLADALGGFLTALLVDTLGDFLAKRPLSARIERLVPQTKEDAAGLLESPNVYRSIIELVLKDIDAVEEQEHAGLIPDSLLFAALKTKSGDVTSAAGAFLEKLPAEERMARLMPRTEADIASLLAAIEAYCSAVQRVAKDLELNLEQRSTLFTRIGTSLSAAEDVPGLRALTEYLRMALLGTVVNIRSSEKVIEELPKERISFMSAGLYLMEANRYQNYDPATEVLDHDINLEAFNILAWNEQKDFVNKLRRSRSPDTQQKLNVLLARLTQEQQRALTPEST